MRNRYLVVADLPLIASAAIGAFALRFDWLFFRDRPEFISFLFAAMLLKPVVFQMIGLYARYWRYASVQDLMAVIFGVTAASCAMSVAVVIGLASGLIAEFSRSVVFIDWSLTLILIGGVRFSVRVVGEGPKWRGRTSAETVRRAIIAGAGQAGILVVREIARNQHLGLAAIGYVDDDPSKRGRRIQGVRVLGSIDELPTIAERYRADEIVIAMPTASGGALRRVAELARAAGIPSKTIPGVYELLGNKSSLRALRDVEVSDLLRRPQVKSAAMASAYLTGRVVLVTGAGGSIGSELCRQVAFSRPERLIMLGHGENSLFEAQALVRENFPDVSVDIAIADIRDEPRMMWLFNHYRPAVVFHAAAHKHVPLMEDNVIEAVTNNVFGTRILTDCAVATGTERFVLISTDKAVAPTSVMGATKKLAECIVRQAAKRISRAFITVRFGNVLGSRGSVVPTFKHQVERGGPVVVTHPEMRRFFMTIPEAVHLVLVSGGLGTNGELFVLEMGEPIRIVDLARDIILLSGFSLGSIPIEFAGLRPGERLQEALWTDSADLQATAQEGILRVIEADNTHERLPSILAQLESAVKSHDPAAVQIVLMEALPSYCPPTISRLDWNRMTGPASALSSGV